MRGMWNPGAALWQPESLLQQLQRPPPALTGQMEPLEPGNKVEFQEYPLDEEANVETTESSKQPGPMTLPSIILPHIPMPTLVPRRGLLVLRWIF